MPTHSIRRSAQRLYLGLGAAAGCCWRCVLVAWRSLPSTVDAARDAADRPEGANGGRGQIPRRRPTRSPGRRRGSATSGFIAYVTCNQTSQYHAAQAREIGDIRQRSTA